MRRRRRNLKPKRQYADNVFLNSDNDSTNDSKNQLDLTPGEAAYKEYLENRKEELKKKQEEEPFHAELEIQNRTLRSRQIKKNKIENAYDTGKKKYRRYMSKDVQVKKMTKIIDDGLDRHIPRRDFNDELFDDGISGDEFPKEAARDYKKEFNKKRELPTEDTNHDNVIDDKDEPVMTPGMRKLAKYM